MEIYGLLDKSWEILGCREFLGPEDVGNSTLFFCALRRRLIQVNFLYMGTFSVKKYPSERAEFSQIIQIIIGQFRFCKYLGKYWYVQPNLNIL